MFFRRSPSRSWLAHWRSSQDRLIERIPLVVFLDPFLKKRTKPSNVRERNPLQLPAPQLNIFTDASINGWGAYCGRQSAVGQWLATETTWHINELEFLAIQKAVLFFLLPITGKIVMFHWDSSAIA